MGSAHKPASIFSRLSTLVDSILAPPQLQPIDSCKMKHDVATHLCVVPFLRIWDF
jgi:hypothetical protein